MKKGKKVFSGDTADFGPANLGLLTPQIPVPFVPILVEMAGKLNPMVREGWRANYCYGSAAICWPASQGRLANCKPKEEWGKPPAFPLPKTPTSRVVATVRGPVLGPIL